MLFLGPAWSGLVFHLKFLKGFPGTFQVAKKIGHASDSFYTPENRKPKEKKRFSDVLKD